MSKPEETDQGAPVPAARRPYVKPVIESDRVVEKQLLVICYTIDQGCQQDPPQS